MAEKHKDKQIQLGIINPFEWLGKIYSTAFHSYPTFFLILCAPTEKYHITHEISTHIIEQAVLIIICWSSITTVIQGNSNIYVLHSINYNLPNIVRKYVNLSLILQMIECQDLSNTHIECRKPQIDPNTEKNMKLIFLAAQWGFIT